MATRKKPARKPARRLPRIEARLAEERREAAAIRRNRKAARAPRRHNGSELADAAALYEQFHGEKPKHVDVVTQHKRERTTLWKCGRLVELWVYIGPKDHRKLIFSGRQPINVCCTGDGGSLYFEAGDQSLPLKALGLDKYLPKDHITVGEVSRIAYFTTKDFHDFAPTIYEHDFGEEDGVMPVLNFDTMNQLMYLTGGSYRVERPGIIN